jgi:diamine N-acetyltransferase
MEISIRKATIKDLEQILALNKALFDYEEEFNSEYNLGWTYSEKGKEYFKDRIENNSSIVLVGEDENKIIGYILTFIKNHSIRSINPIAEVENMFIDKDFRKQGLGSKFLKETIKLAKEMGVKRLEVEVEARNLPALEFYKKNGFEDFELTLQMKLR